MSDDYLWDRSGEPDPDLARLEQLLRPLGHDRGILSATRRTWMRPRRWAVAALAAAAVITIVVGASWLTPTRPSVAPSPAWSVGRLEGTPTISSTPIGNQGRLPLGGALDTDGAARARIDVAEIGSVDVDPGSRVELVRSDDRQYRLRLHWGTVHARIVAPPGRFVVETPSSTVTDLGCAYTLHVDEDGVGAVYVTSGWVAFEWRGRESFIPAGAMCATRPRVGPGTPHFDTAMHAFSEALDRFDFGEAGERDAALNRILALARRDDAMTLWHLLARVDGQARRRVFDRLAALVPPPATVTRDGVLAGDRTMIDEWWQRLGFGSIVNWRLWKQPWSEPTTSR